MKKIILICSFSVSYLGGVIFSQENSLPVNGNVGIGTNNPSTKLDVKGRVNIDSSLVVKDSVKINKTLRVEQNARFMGETKMNDAKVLNNFTSNGVSKFNGDVRFTALGDLANLSNKYVVVTNENGLAKKVSYDNLIESLRIGIYAPPITASPQPIDYCQVSGGYNAQPYWISGQNKLFVKCPEVKVGIGTDTPSHGLNVTTDVKFNSTLFVGYTMGIGTEAEDFARLTIKNTNRPASLSIKQLNTGPYTKLMYMEYSEPSTEVLKVVNVATGNTSYLFEASGKMTVNNGTTDIFKLETDGKFTIANGTQKILQLEANGMLRGRRIKLDVDNWADFVFEDGYQLMPLEEVEAFVKDQKHLPNVPSEQELKKSGMDVQEMNAVLMQKVEELTLYLIEQNKELETMKQRIEELETVK